MRKLRGWDEDQRIKIREGGNGQEKEEVGGTAAPLSDKRRKKNLP